MKTAVIWDLDGTLFDSYRVIVDSIYQTFTEFGISCDKEEIHRHSMCFSINSLFAEYAQLYRMDVQLLNQRYSQISGGKYMDITVMKHGREVLKGLSDRGAEHYVYTHRGKTTIPVLNNLQLTEFFREIVTSQNALKLKPNPEGIQYLMEKYNLDSAHTYYVGDRSLDMECAKNAGIPGILFMPDGAFDVSGAETYRIKDLLEILDIL